MEPIDREVLPTVDEARAIARERRTTKEQQPDSADPSTKKRDKTIAAVADELVDAVEHVAAGGGVRTPEANEEGSRQGRA